MTAVPVESGERGPIRDSRADVSGDPLQLRPAIICLNRAWSSVSSRPSDTLQVHASQSWYQGVCVCVSYTDSLQLHGTE